MTPVLQIKNLKVSFSQDGQTIEAVKGVSLDVAKGETLALVGESGSGKSVTALSTVDLLSGNATRSGSVRFRDTELVGASERDLMKVRGNDISFIFQEPMTSLNPLHTIEKQLSESIVLHQGVQGKEVRNRVLALLEKVGIPDPESRLKSYPHQLSGGQRQRVMIAMALANGPELLIADEPTTALDVTIEAQILDLLLELQKSEGMALLFITHDLGIVRKIADRVCVMKDGEIVEAGDTDKIFDAPQHPYTKKLIEAETVGSPQTVPDNAETLLETESLRVWFPIQRGLLRRTVGYVKAVNDASLSIRAGETLGVVGESGSGKTSLALAIMRLIESKNKIAFLGQDIQGLNRSRMRPLRRDMQVVFQDPYGSLSPRMSVAEIIAEGLNVHGTPDGVSVQKVVEDILIEVGIDPGARERYPHEFSGGQRQRIAVARAMILKPKFVVLDEPTSALDRTVQTQIVDLLRDLQAKYQLGYLFISHDLKVVRALSHNVVVMKNGEIVESGSATEIFDNPRHEYTQTLLRAALS